MLWVHILAYLPLSFSSGLQTCVNNILKHFLSPTPGIFVQICMCSGCFHVPALMWEHRFFLMGIFYWFWPHTMAYPLISAAIVLTLVLFHFFPSGFFLVLLRPFLFQTFFWKLKLLLVFFVLPILMDLQPYFLMTGLSSSSNHYFSSTSSSTIHLEEKCFIFNFLKVSFFFPLLCSEWNA